MNFVTTYGAGGVPHGTGLSETSKIPLSASTIWGITERTNLLAGFGLVLACFGGGLDLGDFNSVGGPPLHRGLRWNVATWSPHPLVDQHMCMCARCYLCEVFEVLHLRVMRLHLALGAPHKELLESVVFR